LGKAEKLLQTLTGRKPVRTISVSRIPTWGLKKGEPIGCKVTLRGPKADEVIKRLLAAREKRLPASSFDENGNVSFGLSEYIDVDGLKYDPDIGIMGLNCTVTIERPGFRVKHRKIRAKQIHEKYRVSSQESIEYFKNNFGVEIE